jgi:hypothetical protein
VSRPKWKLTVRNGPDVDHASFADLGEAVASMREQALAIRAEGPNKPVNSVRRFEPRQQVNARLQLSRRRGLFGKETAGVDVRGDGSFVPFAGGVTREELDPTDHDTPFDLVRETLEQS